MKLCMAWLSLLLFSSSIPALASDSNKVLPSSPMGLEGAGATLDSKQLNAATKVVPNTLQELGGNVSSDLLSKIAGTTTADQTGVTRSAKDAKLYRAISPSVVMIVTKDGLGSGSLVTAAGDIITNYHVVAGYDSVAVVFKPTKEGSEPGRDDIRRGQVIKYDEVADLALVQVLDLPPGRTPILLGKIEEISVGADVSAIGHPTGEAWTYTRGVISQYRLGYAWGNEGEDIKHKADIIQTQTPINPGNSGGPLISDSGDMIGVNSFKSKGEGLNFAVSIDEVQKFIARPGNRAAQKKATAPQAETKCTPKEMKKYRSKENNSSVISYDMFCNGKVSGEYVIPDNANSAIFLRVDRNGDGKSDLVVYDLKRRGKWDISFWDEKFTGEYTLVGYHDDGTLKASRFESYATYKGRLASNQ